MECVIAGLTMKDTCMSVVGHEASAELENAASFVLVEGPKTLLSEEERGKCSLGGAETALAFGGDGALEALEGGSAVALELSEE
jgi:hypothetical protein